MHSTETVCFISICSQCRLHTSELSPLYFPRLTTVLQHFYNYCRFKIQIEGAQALTLGYVTSVLWSSNQCL